ncbi:MAG TPA: hypothetical protein VNU70_01565, partial [Puia sp.]|nr:hypothetical protein [Puia sp.]
SYRNIPPIEPVKRAGSKGGAGVADPTVLKAGAGTEDRAVLKGGTIPADTPALNEKGARLLVEEGAEQATRAGAGAQASLTRIRQQMASRRQQDEVVSSLPLEPEALHRAWRQYADYLRENRNPAVQSLELAALRIIDAQNFEVVTSNNLEQKFIEQEKRNLSEHLQKAFSNKSISFTVTIEEKEVSNEAPATPGKREQFRQIVEQYPLVKELKDRLRLELDY